MLAIIPARFGSQRIPGKNLTSLGGFPLIAWAIAHALASNCYDRVVVSTDSHEIAETARKFGAEVPFLRPAELASSHSRTVDTIAFTLNRLRELEGYEPEFTAVLQPTSPVRDIRDSDLAFDALRGSSCHSLVTLQEIPHAYAPQRLMSLIGTMGGAVRASDPAEDSAESRLLARNGASLYMFHTRYLCDDILPAPVLGHLQHSSRALDINDWWDLFVAKSIFEHAACIGKNPELSPPTNTLLVAEQITNDAFPIRIAIPKSEL